MEAQSSNQVTGSDTQDSGRVNETVEKKGVVSWESHEVLLKQRKADQERLREATEKLALFEQAEKEKAEQEMLKRGEFEKALQAKEKELRLAREEAAKIKEAQVKTVKLSAFQEALGGKLKRPEYYSHVDVNKIAIDPETGSIDYESVQSYVNEFVGNFNDLIAFNQGKLPSNAPKHSQALSYDEWLNLPLAEKKRRMNEVMNTNQTRR